MIKFWFYFIVFVFLAVVGLAIGSANDAKVMFDFLFVQKEIPVASVLVIGVIFGFILGIYASLLLCLKLWFKEKSAKSALNKLKKEVDKQNDSKTAKEYICSILSFPDCVHKSVFCMSVPLILPCK